MSGRGITRGRAVRIEPNMNRDNRGAVAGVPGEGGGGSSSGSSRGGSPDTSIANLRQLTIHEGNDVVLPHDGGLGNGRNRANGNGNGNGAVHTGVGLRGQPLRREQTLEDFDIVRTRPEGVGKQGGSGQRLNLIANYFEVNRKKNWNLIQYHVEFAPDQELTRSKKFLLKQFRAQIGPHIFDGASLFTPRQLIFPPAEEMVLVGVLQREGTNNAPNELIVRVRQVAILDPETTMYVQFFNLVVKTCQQHIGLTWMGRHYYDPEGAVNVPNHRLQLWPGFITVMRQHERNLLLCVEITHRVIRTDSVLEIMNQTREQVRSRGGEISQVKEAVKQLLVGVIVMTTYNKKTYRVDDILWAEKATDTFPIRDRRTGDDVQTSYIDYYKKKYDVNVRNSSQPLLVSKPKARDVRRGQEGPIKLLPELCKMTGLTDDMRKNFRLMKDLGEHLFQQPHSKMDSIGKFMNRIRNSPEVKTDLEQWGLDISANPARISGRILQREKIVFGEGKLVETDDKADWTNAFRSSKMVSSVALQRWVVVVPQREFHSLENLLKTMRGVGLPIGFNMSRPLEIVQISNINANTYTRALQDIIDTHKSQLDMIFVILGNNKIEAYSAVKRKCNVEYGYPSQCFLANNMNKPKGLMSIATKVVIQMNAKLGGEPWNLQIPLKNTMFVGFDVYHASPSSKSQSIGAMVCTTSAGGGRYFSTMSFHDNRTEVSSTIAADFTKCLRAYKKVNDRLPERVFFYRDAVGDGQLYHVNKTELESIKKSIRVICDEERIHDIKLTFIVVTKRINARVFLDSRHGHENPRPGTVVDDHITLPERWDFFLVSPIARQGTVSPTSYNILCEGNGLDADKVQRLTYKLCHGYYNWSGTVAVPAPCQYAHKLAYLTGEATKAQANGNLQHLLYFL